MKETQLTTDFSHIFKIFKTNPQLERFYKPHAVIFLHFFKSSRFVGFSNIHEFRWHLMHFFSFSNTSMPTPTHMLLGQLPVCVLIAVLTARGGWPTLVAACHCQQARLPCDWRTRPKLGSQSVILVSPSLPPRAPNLLNNVIYWRGGWGCLQQQYTCPNNPHPPPPSNVLLRTWHLLVTLKNRIFWHKTSNNYAPGWYIVTVLLQ